MRSKAFFYRMLMFETGGEWVKICMKFDAACFSAEVGFVTGREDSLFRNRKLFIRIKWLK